MFVFVFKQKTAYEIPKRDWSSDVCSSDLACFMLTFANVYESCTTLEVWDGAGEAAGGAWSCALLFCCGSRAFGS